MKTRAVVVWFDRPVYTESRRKGARTQLDLVVVVQESAGVVADRLLGSLESHEDPPRGEIAQAMTDMVKVAHSLQVSAPTPGLRWVGECAEFQLRDGSLCVIPRDLIAWVELGPEVDG